MNLTLDFDFQGVLRRMLTFYLRIIFHIFVEIPKLNHNFAPVN